MNLVFLYALVTQCEVGIKVLVEDHKREYEPVLCEEDEGNTKRLLTGVNVSCLRYFSLVTVTSHSVMKPDHEACGYLDGA